MPNYRRAWVPGGTFFFTVVTYNRRRVFADVVARRLLGAAFRECLRRRPFRVDAVVLLPDHLRAIWSLPPGDADFSKRWARIKREFTRQWLAAGKRDVEASAGKRRERRRGVWQPRFWEHTIADGEDFDHHFDYIHYNPVRHGLVDRVREWPWSTFHRWARAGVYPTDWGGGVDSTLIDSMERSTGEP